MLGPQMTQLDETHPEKPKSLREHHKQITRRRICDAARSCFVERGFDGASVEDISARAGVSRATFYVHYANKDEVLLEFIKEVERERRGLFRQLLRLTAVNRTEVRAWLAETIAAHRAHSQTYRLLRVGVATNPAFQQVIVASRLKIMEDLGARFPNFSLEGQRGRTLERMRVEAMLMIIQLEMFCGSMTTGDGSMDEAAGLDVLSERLLAFLTGAPSP